MPTHQTKRGEQTRLRITQAAAELVHRQGFYHTSLDDILAAARVPKGSLYFHFKNKDELGLAVIRYRREMLLTTLEQIFGQAGSLPTQLQQWFALMERIQQTSDGCYGCPVGNLAQELSQADSAFAEEIDQFFIQSESLLLARLQLAQQEDDIRPHVQPKEIASFLLMVSQGASLLAKTRNSLVPLREAYKTVVQFLDSLAPHTTHKTADSP